MKGTHECHENWVIMNSNDSTVLPLKTRLSQNSVCTKNVVIIDCERLLENYCGSGYFLFTNILFDCLGWHHCETEAVIAV